MQTFTAPDPLNGETLRTEIAAAGVTMGDGRPSLADGELVLDVTEGDRAAVQAVLDAHTGAPSPRVANEAAINDRLDQAIAALRSHVDRAKPSTAAAQASAAYDATVLLCRVAIGVIRIMRRRLDGTD